MKKVLALVLTLAMLLGTLAVGLSAAFEYTATEDGDVFENVYSIPLGSQAYAVTYFQVNEGTFSSANINLSFDIWFTGEDSYFGSSSAGFGSDIRPMFTPDKIGMYVNGTENTIDYDFELNTKYTLAFRTGGAEEGKTLIRVNDQDVGQVDGRIATDPTLFTQVVGVIMDNIVCSDGNNYQIQEDLEDGSWDGGVSACDGEGFVSAIEVRRDLGKKYLSVGGTEVGHHYQLTKVLGADGEGNVAPYSAVTVSFDFQLLAEDSYVESWGSSAPSVYPNGISVGHEKTPFIEHPFEINTWYYAEFVSDGAKTDAYIDGVLVGTLDTAICFGRDGAIANAGKFWTPYNKNAAIDNVAVNGYAHTFEDSGEEYLVDLNGATITSNILEYVGEKVDIWEHIQTYDVEGEATLLKAPFNEAKDPNSEENMLYLDFSYDAGTLNDSYIMSFDLAIYPDKETMTTEDKTENGSWMDWIVRIGKDGSGNAQFFDDDRIKIGNKFVGKNKDLYYYGEEAPGSAVQDMQPWAAGEFHNVTLQVSNGTATIYLDKTEVYSVPVSANQIDTLGIMYLWNCSVIIDNFYIYDAKTFEPKVEGFVANGSGGDSAVTLSDVTAEGATFCETNGCHINYWARKEDPKCYDMGTNTYTCWVCGNAVDEKEVSMLEHHFAKYDITRVNEEGLVYTYCDESEGCTERRYIQLPEATDYTGAITYFHDFQDDFITHLDNASWNWTIADGVSSFVEGNDLNYNQFPLEGNRTGAELNEGYKISFDFIYNGIYETTDTPRYGNTFYIRVGRQLIGDAKVGYDAVNQQFYIASDAAFPEIRGEVYPLVAGETYNFEVVLGAMDHDNFSSALELYVNGEKVLEMDPMDAYLYLAYEDSAEIGMFLMYNFGVAMSIDNFVVGDNDFAWNRQYQGDVDGDYAITLSDALLMRKYLAKIDGIETLVASRADANVDGVIDAKDQLRIRKAIAAATPEA